MPLPSGKNPYTESPTANSVTPGPDFDHHAGAFAAEQCLVGEHAQGDHDVAEVRGDGAKRHPNLARLQRGASVGNGLQLQVFEGARAADAQPPRSVAGRRHDAVDRAAAADSRGVDLAAAQQYLRFADRQNGGYRVIIKGRIGIHQHDPAGMLGLRRTHQPPHRRAG